MAAQPFTYSPALTAVAVAYLQAELIADKVLPRLPVDAELFAYNKYALGDAFRNPDTLVGRKSAPNQLDWNATRLTDSTQDHGLDAPVPNKDVQMYQAARAAGLTNTRDPLASAATMVTGAVMNRREYRAAQLVFGAANYAVANKVTLSGTGQWSDYTNSNPVDAIVDVLDAMVMRPNKGVLGSDTASKLLRHPKVVSRLYGGLSTRGSARLVDLAEELGLDEIYVGRAWIDTAAPGQASVLARAWGKHASFTYSNPNAAPEGAVTFGFTAEWGTRIGGTIDDPDVGLRGGTRVRVGESVKELITANDLGYLFTNAVA
ncbi:MAG: hypothetical protein RL375_861 [Pseudomonadota bacterium]